MSDQGKRLDSFESDALEVSRRLKKNAKSKEKASISATVSNPFKTKATGHGGETFRQQWRKTATGVSEEEQRKAILQTIEVFKLLPAASAYAQHRLKVLNQALQILDKDRQGFASLPACRHGMPTVCGCGATDARL